MEGTLIIEIPVHQLTNKQAANNKQTFFRPSFRAGSLNTDEKTTTKAKKVNFCSDSQEIVTCSFNE